jgi:ATP-dependent DNA helicase RecQ
MEERFGSRHVCDIITGVRNEYVESYEHYKLPSFALGKDQTGDYWYSLLRQLTINNLLERDTDNQIVLRITPKGEEYLKKPFGITLAADHDFTNTEVEDEEASQEAAARTRSYDEGLFNQLKLLVKKVAKEKGLPPYVIFQEPSLAEMATVYPCTEQELSQIVGVGMGKVKKFGTPFLAAINKYVEDNEIETGSDVVIKSNANKSKQKIDIIAQIDRKIALDEICERIRMNMPSLLTEIENICFSGTKLNLDYYLDTIMESDRQGEIEDYFLASETDSLDIAVNELGEEYSEEEIRLMRIKFFNEHAN